MQVRPAGVVSVIWVTSPGTKPSATNQYGAAPPATGGTRTALAASSAIARVPPPLIRPSQSTPASTTPGYSRTKDAQLKRLRRIEGQIRGLQRMIEEDKYCIDVLTQVSAATKALQSFSLELLDQHLAHCVVEAAQRGGAEADEKVREASAAIARLVRS